MKMKMNVLFFLVISLGLTSIGFGQNQKDETLLVVGDKPITTSEFLAIYKKNAFKESGAESKTISEYLDLFVKFKLKVREAESLKMDTSRQFKEELAGYRKQLAQPYLTDSAVNEAIIKEAYGRLLFEVKASHILVSCAENAFPKDTLKAYDSIMSIRNLIIGKKLPKLDFETAARLYSSDRSARENGGNLGYFSVLQTVYPFENVAYNSPIGEVSMPVRTRFGYHLVMVTDKRATRGELLCAHIMIKTPKGMSTADSINARHTIEEILAKARSGSDFAELAKQFSDDKGSASKGGELPWFGTNKMPAEIERVAFDLKNNGDISDIFKTKYGWHILKRIDHRGVPAFEDLKADLKGKIIKDARSQKGREFKIAKIKKEYHLKEELKNLDPIYSLVDSSFFKGKWKNVQRALALNKPLFYLGSKEYNQHDFALFLESHQVKQNVDPSKYTVMRLYKQFLDESCIAYEEANLDQKYPTFRALMQEYRDGILLFDLTDKRVWSKAVRDTAGLRSFYEANKQNYMWPERCDAVLFNCLNEKVANEVEKLLKKGKSSTAILDEVNKKSQLNLRVESRVFMPKDNALVDGNWKVGVSTPIKQDDRYYIVKVNQIVVPSVKPIVEAKGLVTADYQNFLEKEWLTQLQKKYSVTINQQVLSNLH